MYIDKEVEEFICGVHRGDYITLEEMEVFVKTYSHLVKEGKYKEIIFRSAQEPVEYEDDLFDKVWHIYGSRTITAEEQEQANKEAKAKEKADLKKSIEKLKKNLEYYQQKLEELK